MEIYPAVDIQDGRAVRLEQGDFERVTVFDDSPLAAARRWAEAGAGWIHMVDLDGARSGKPVNAERVRETVEGVEARVQLGGGLRDMAAVEAALGLGVERVVLGTAAVENRDLLVEACEKYPGRIVVGIDARDGMVATHGWAQDTAVTALWAIEDVSLPGVAAIVFTDIGRDGMMQGPNLESLKEAVEAARKAGMPVIASGGISTIADMRAVAEAGAAGAIIGRALYDGSIDLAEALRVAAEVGG